MHDLHCLEYFMTLLPNRIRTRQQKTLPKAQKNKERSSFDVAVAGGGGMIDSHLQREGRMRWVEGLQTKRS
ncbi:hypothetical protein GGP41_000294, partial [Bipolaris sorokiniana]